MEFWLAIKRGFYNYVQFSGRASRAEFWYFVLFDVLTNGISQLIDTDVAAALFHNPQAEFFSTLQGLCMFLPMLSVTVRRLHDRNFRGWWILIQLTIIGLIPLVIWWCQKGTLGPNRFGPEPLPLMPAPKEDETRFHR